MRDSGKLDEMASFLCPQRVAVIGGGRWARVLAGVLCDLVPSSTNISIHSLHNVESMALWAAQLSRPVEVSSKYPSGSSLPGAVIIANAARDHEKAIEWAISVGVPAFVEKPITAHWRTTQCIAELVQSQGMCLAVSNVFLFTRYIENFSKFISTKGGIKKIQIEWCDSLVETRYGEKKQFDPGIPVYVDVLPHIVSILGVFKHQEQAMQCQSLHVHRGGALVELEMDLANIPCYVKVERNSTSRKRVLSVETHNEVCQLDFSKEPGWIKSSLGLSDADPHWAVKMRPIESMLGAFLNWAAGGPFDNRLNFNIGLQASHVIQQVESLYRPAIIAWLQEKIKALDADLHYALRENFLESL